MNLDVVLSEKDKEEIKKQNPIRFHNEITDLDMYMFKKLWGKDDKKFRKQGCYECRFIPIVGKKWYMIKNIDYDYNKKCGCISSISILKDKKEREEFAKTIKNLSDKLK